MLLSHTQVVVAPVLCTSLPISLHLLGGLSQASFFDQKIIISSLILLHIIDFAQEGQWGNPCTPQWCLLGAVLNILARFGPPMWLFILFYELLSCLVVTFIANSSMAFPPVQVIFASPTTLEVNHLYINEE